MTVVESDLQKLRIDKAHKARRDERSSWPWAVVLLLALAAGVGAWQWRATAATASVQTVRVRVPDAGSATAQASDAVLLNATGYVMAAHKIELASKSIGRVAWVGVEMGDKVKKD